MIIDKNDVDISKLFLWKREVELNVYGQIQLVYMRIIGDADLNRARVFALRRSAELRKKLRTLDTEERIAYIPDYEIISDNELVTGLLALSIKEITSKAIDEVKVPLPAEPTSDATLEQQEEYQKKVDEYPVIREMEIRKYVEKALDREQKKWQKFSKDKLYDIYLTSAINQLCEAEMLKKFREMSAYFATYKDEEFKQRLFPDYESFEDLPSDIKEQLINAYIELDIEGEVLKKLPELTQ